MVTDGDNDDAFLSVTDNCESAQPWQRDSPELLAEPSSERAEAARKEEHLNALDCPAFASSEFSSEEGGWA